MRDYDFYYTQDGSIGLYSFEDSDVYHSKFGALTEAWVKFILPAQLDKIINKKKNINILDICYGVGYNTKALMTFVLNNNKNKLKKINFEKFFNDENFIKANNIDTKYTNKSSHRANILLSYIDKIYSNIFSTFNIDCLEAKEELVKISPFLKSNNYKLDFLKMISPSIYFKIKKIVSKNTFIYNLLFKKRIRNKQFITELLDLKFNDDFVNIDEKYKINKFVNPIINCALSKQYKYNRLSKKCIKLLNDKHTKKYLNKKQANFDKFPLKNRHIFPMKLFKLTFLHNIYYKYLSSRYKKIDFKLASSFFNLNFYINDARKSIFELNREYDLIFFDAFSYTKAPQLWTIEFFNILYDKLSSDGLLLTYSTSALVRKTLLENNFYVGKIIDPHSNKIVGTIASKNKKLIQHPLNNYEIGLCNTKAGIPYHDVAFSLSNEKIYKMREKEFYESDLMTASKYKKLRDNSNGDNDD